jgi:hypothetical protein
MREVLTVARFFSVVVLCAPNVGKRTFSADCAEEDCSGAEGEMAKVKAAKKTG